ncbi:MAG: class I SAM-dependent methyltransferase [Flavobacteriales bacterium]|nr:class I SAM-dependent methyltransferase [Flavobacteriales bacterium]
MNADQLQTLENAAEWGGRAWTRMLRSGLTHLLRDMSLEGKTVLELGPRSGKMAVWFAKQGAKVTAMDIRAHYLDQAREEVSKNKVDVNLMLYDGDLGILADHSFDVIFTKSVLVMIPEQHATVIQLARILKPGGRVLFVENGQLPRWLRFFRKLRHRSWDDSNVRYLTHERLEHIRKNFSILAHESTSLPPVHMLYGTV